MEGWEAIDGVLLRGYIRWKEDAVEKMLKIAKEWKVAFTEQMHRIEP